MRSLISSLDLLDILHEYMSKVLQTLKEQIHYIKNHFPVSVGQELLYSNLHMSYYIRVDSEMLSLNS